MVSGGIRPRGRWMRMLAPAPSGSGRTHSSVVRSGGTVALTRSMWNALYPMPVDCPGLASRLVPISFHSGHRWKGWKGGATSARIAVARRRNCSPSPRAWAMFPRRTTAYPPAAPLSATRRGPLISLNSGAESSLVRYCSIVESAWKAPSTSQAGSVPPILIRSSSSSFGRLIKRSDSAPEMRGNCCIDPPVQRAREPQVRWRGSGCAEQCGRDRPCRSASGRTPCLSCPARGGRARSAQRSGIWARSGV